MNDNVIIKIIKYYTEGGKKWGRRDLNPQPLDLESNALPLELRPLELLALQVDDVVRLKF